MRPKTGAYSLGGRRYRCQITLYRFITGGWWEKLGEEKLQNCAECQLPLFTGRRINAEKSVDIDKAGEKFYFRKAGKIVDSLIWVYIMSMLETNNDIIYNENIKVGIRN